MAKGCAVGWQMAAAAFFGGLCLLLAWDSPQSPQSDPAPTQAASAGITTNYHALTRADIMLAEAGLILN